MSTRAPEYLCVACGRTGRRGFIKTGGFYLDRLGPWYAERSMFLEPFYICQARLACMRRIYGSGYSRYSFGEVVRDGLYA